MLRKRLLKRLQKKLLDLMAEVKSDIQDIQRWIDDSLERRVYKSSMSSQKMGGMSAFRNISFYEERTLCLPVTQERLGSRNIRNPF